MSLACSLQRLHPNRPFFGGPRPSSSRRHPALRCARGKRRTRRLLVAPLTLTLALVVEPAAAFELGTPAEEHPFRTAQNFAFELRLSPYWPAIDDDPRVPRTPFENAFGGHSRLAVGVEIDWQVLRIPRVGTIGPGLAMNTVTLDGPAGGGTKDEPSLTIRPFTLAAVLRADVFWRELGVPIAPFAKMGLGAGFWNVSNANGTSRVSLDGGLYISGSGVTWGTYLAGGVAFPLDALDEGASRSIDAAVGINNTYLYVEYYWLNLNGLAQDTALHVGTSTWAAGLAFEL
ncbi:MAG TPA: MXAN_2562 family outer membrane beta-barrel protein [Labilithrix sp.]|nr:MXAN_2562 family outer membrane beta-barrel protein [Labilithrix sp.]